MMTNILAGTTEWCSTTTAEVFEASEPAVSNKENERNISFESLKKVVAGARRFGLAVARFSVLALIFAFCLVVFVTVANGVADLVGTNIFVALFVTAPLATCAALYFEIALLRLVYRINKKVNIFEQYAEI